MHKEFAVTPPAHDPRWMIAVFAGLPIVVGIGLGFSGLGHRPMLLPAAGMAMAIFLVAFLVLGWAAKRRAIMLDDGVLDILATFYRRRVPVQEIDFDASRVIDLRERREWRPLWRINGFAMPGLYAGWFRSRDLKRLFCLVTDRQHVLLLTLRAGGALLLSAARPMELLVALRSVDDAQRGRR